MKGVLLSKKSIVEYTSLEDVLINDDVWVKIRVNAVGLCGSDVQKIFSDYDYAANGENILLGHEFSGQISEIGKKTSALEVGMRVTANPLVPCYSCPQCDSENYNLCQRVSAIGRDLAGAFAEYVLVPSKNVRPIPENMSFEVAAMTDLVAVALHSYNLAGSPDNKRILIYGDGAIGLSCLQVYKAKNNKTFMIGKHPLNLEIARNLGAAESIPLSEADSLKSDQFDVVVEAVGKKQSDTINKAISLVRPAGKVVVLGVFEKEYLGIINLRQLFYKEALLFGSNSYSIFNGKNEFDAALGMIKDGIVDFTKIITHKLPLSDFNKGLELISNKDKFGAIKVVYNP